MSSIRLCSKQTARKWNGHVRRRHKHYFSTVGCNGVPHLETENIVFCTSFAETDTLDGVEAFRHVGLYRAGVSRLREDLQQFIIRQEEEPAFDGSEAGRWLAFKVLRITHLMQILDYPDS